MTTLGIMLWGLTWRVRTWPERLRRARHYNARHRSGAGNVIGAYAG